MNFLVIDDDLILADLTPELKRIYDRYQAALTQRTEFQILRSKYLGGKISKVWYYEECVKLAKNVKNISFRSDRGVFEASFYLQNKKHFLGASDNFDEACEFLSIYFEEILNQKKIKND